MSNHGRIHDWKMEVSTNSLTEAREEETEDLWGWVNTHADRLDLKRTEDRDDDAPRYTVEFYAATETSADTLDVEAGEASALWSGDSRAEVGEPISEFLRAHGPDGLGYDGPGDHHDNGRQTSAADSDEEQADSETDTDSLKETLMNRLREKYSKDDGDGLDYSALQKVAGKHDVPAVGLGAEEMLEKIAESRVEEQAA